MWKRFLDDCFIPWTRTREDLNKFNSILNNLHRYINFTMEIGEKQISFLDCKIIKTGTKIDNIFYKPTDSKTYLLFSSCHPKHTKVSIAFSLARRLKLIVSDPNTLSIRLQELQEYLRKQNYPLSLIKGSIEKAKKLKREEILNPNNNNSNNKNIIPFISTHNPHNPSIFGAIKQNLDILKRDSHMKQVLENTTFINSKRQPDNLKKLLTRAKFPISIRIGAVSKCNRPTAASVNTYCKELNTNSTVASTSL